jgi:tetratricopeptide (TPR) repeat protein
MPDLILPPALISAVQEQRAILFLGAGASHGAAHPKGERVPLGDKLRDMVCDKFLGGQLKSRPLTSVAAMAAAEVGLVQFQKFIRDIFIEFNPTDFHLLVPTFRWRAMATTNFDLIVERSYERSRASVQTLVKSWKDGDGFDQRMQEVSDPVGFYKLHGCLDYYTDESIPLILGQEEYASYTTNRTRFYNPLLKQNYRRVAREKLSGDVGRLTQYDLHTRARVAIDELRDTIAGVGRNEDAASTAALLAATKDAETAIERGRSDFPQSAELLAVEADFRDLLNQAPQALATLERAFKLNPRQDWLAIRLAKRYTESGDNEKAIDVIRRCLQENPGSKPAQLAMAHVLRRINAPRERILDHLKRSFTPGDNNFEGQFWYARELFLDHKVQDAQTIFASLNDRAPGRYRNDTAATVFQDDGRSMSFDGLIARKEEGYAFVSLFEFAAEIFASRADSEKFDWDKLHTHSQISCYLAFNRRGPRAIKLTARRA